MALGTTLGIDWCGCGGASSYVCNDTLVQGEGSLVDNTILLNPNGGVLTIMFYAPGVGTVDKLEIYHGNPTNGTKVATTGMTTLNAGPFDNVYGTVSTGDVIPTEAQALATDQFIGSSKGTVPTRATAYTAETSIANPLVAPFEQLIWWVYTPADYQVSSYASIRVTGPVGTKWDFKPYCE
jgi:hypothetical protein